jgi:hypothetical protein
MNVERRVTWEMVRHMIKFQFYNTMSKSSSRYMKIMFWITQFGVLMRKLHLLEDHNTGQARNGHREGQATHYIWVE